MSHFSPLALLTIRSIFSSYIREPTKKKWTPEEQLCNARGLNDGYVFVHASHPLAEAATSVLKDEVDGKTLKALNTIAGGKCPEFAGCIRQPLSHELHTADDGTTVSPPKAASKITRESHDALFSDDLEQNLALCVTFNEPAKEPHMSVVLPRAVPPAPILKPEDKVIRRPKLSFGGGTIANLGGRNNSHKAGYGSMNISSYERELAQRTGRGAQMNQAGTRAWGAMEPTAKRQRYNGGGPPGQQPQGGYRPQQQYQQQPYRAQLHAGHSNAAGWPQQQQQQGYYAKGSQMSQWRHQGGPPPPPPPPPPPNQQGYGNQPRQGYQQQGYNRHQAPPPPPPQRQGYSFNRPGAQQQQQPRQPYQQQGQGAARPGFSFNRQGQQQQQNRWQPPQQQQQQQGGGGAKANPALMASLRSQLSATLKKNQSKK